MPAVSEKQQRAMYAARAGKSRLGIPRSVGEEFVGKDAVAAAQGHAAGIIYVAPDGRILLLRRADTEPNFGGYWALPGGKGEAGETPEATALREAGEEMAGAPAPSAGLQLFDVKTTPTGMAFYTYAGAAQEAFTPHLNDEHSGFAWAPLSKLPGPLHPAVAASLAERLGLDDTALTPEQWGELVSNFADWAANAANDDTEAGGAQDSLALDRASIRSYDADGRLHISQTPISKANICEYFGREIPGAAALGLQPDRRYKLLREAGELAKGAATFNNIQVLRRHIAVSADDHKPDEVIGATGSDAAFEAPYLVNSMVIWAKGDIQLIEADAKKELSCAYRYRPDMTPGTLPDGQSYDGVMRDIVGNHVAVVEAGRAGPDVVVADSMPANPYALASKFAADEAETEPKAKEPEMPSTKISLSPRATLVRGSLLTFLAPRLAADAAIDLPKILKPVTDKNWKDQRPIVEAAVIDATKGKLAADQKLDGLGDVLLALDAAEAPDLPMPGGIKGKGPGAADKRRMGKDKRMGKDEAETLKERLKGKMGEDEFKAACDEIDEMTGDDDPQDEDDRRTRAADSRRRARDEKDDDDEKNGKGADDADTDKDDDKVDKKAMDEAIAGALDKQRGAREAERFVRPWVGDLAIAYDSADGVFGAALKMRGIKVDGVHPSAYKTMLEMLPKAGAEPANGRRNADATLGMDSAIEDRMAKRFPYGAQIKLGGGVNG